MKLISLCLVALVLAGCGPKAKDPEPKKDNTATNERDRNGAAKTPIDQNENKADIDVTAKIRSRVVETEKSIKAENVKIITQNGKVTLRGPVTNAGEKDRIEKIAKEVAGEGNVSSELEIQP